LKPLALDFRTELFHGKKIELFIGRFLLVKLHVFFDCFSIDVLLSTCISKGIIGSIFIFFLRRIENILVNFKDLFLRLNVTTLKGIEDVFFVWFL